MEDGGRSGLKRSNGGSIDGEGRLGNVGRRGEGEGLNDGTCM